jgi:hypothetical protein
MVKQIFDGYINQGFDVVLAVKNTVKDLENNQTLNPTNDQTNVHTVGKMLFGERVWQQKLVSYALG